MDTKLYEYDREEMLDNIKLDPTDAITLCLHCTKENCRGTCAAVEAILYKKPKHKEPKKSTIRTYTYKGMTKTRKEWAEYFGLTYNTFCGMVDRQHDVIKAIERYEQLLNMSVDALGA